MSKLGIALQAFAMASISGGYVPPSYYRKQTTYNRDERHDQLSVTNPDPKVAQSVSTFVQGSASSNACAGVNQTITSIGTTLVTMNCTGTVNMSTWAAGFSGGGGAFSKSAISVTNGQVFLIENSSGTASRQATFICDHSVGNCKTGAGGPANGAVCSTPAGLSLSNLVCAAASTSGYNGGLATNSIGSTKFNGGTGHGGSGYSFAGGGAAGPDGAGQDGVASTAGGAGDNGLGGAGGSSVSGSHNGVSNALGGGGAGCKANPGGAGGGNPGAGGASCNGGAYTNGDGQVVIHGALSPEMEILTGGSGYSGGTISAA